MPLITSVSLTIEKDSADSDPDSLRLVTVRFTTKFSLYEWSALFNAAVSLQAMEGSLQEPNQLDVPLGVVMVHANSTFVSTVMTRVLERGVLDEDKDVRHGFDQHGHPIIVVYPPLDEWRARVRLTQVVQSTSRVSATISGSWGELGSN